MDDLDAGTDAVLSRLPARRHSGVHILALLGSELTDHGDHVVVSTPHNPDFHWGNYVIVTDDASDADLDDADRWVTAFRRHFPDARHVVIDLPRSPRDLPAYLRHGLSVTTDDALGTTTRPRELPAPAGYTIRPLQGADFEASAQLRIDDNARTGRHPQETYAPFTRAANRDKARLVESGHGFFVGAITSAGTLVSDLGIVVLGPGERLAGSTGGGRVARYQDVLTDPEHRRRGLTGHLLGVAARWAADHGANEWLILTETHNPAGRLYRSVGFEPIPAGHAAYRAD